MVSFGLMALPASTGRMSGPQLPTLLQEVDESNIFRTVWFGEVPPLGRRYPAPDPIVRMASIATLTRRVRLALGCLTTFPVRDPLFLASQWASLDRLAGPGRLILAACQGESSRPGSEMQAAAFGIPWGQARVRRMEEGIEVLRALLCQDRVTYEGDFLKYTDVSVGPAPITQPCPPIWIAANPRKLGGKTGAIDRMVLRVGRIADGWMTEMLTAEDFADRWQRILDAAEKAGRDPAAIDNALEYDVCVNDDRDAAYAETKAWHDSFYRRDWEREVLERWVAYGRPDDVAAKLKTYVDAGAKELCLRLTGTDIDAQLQRLIEDVIPLLN